MRIKLQHAARTVRDNKLVPAGFYFEIQADGNHETLATSEIYNTKEAAEEAIALIYHTSIGDWEVVDETA